MYWNPIFILSKNHTAVNFFDFNLISEIKLKICLITIADYQVVNLFLSLKFNEKNQIIYHSQEFENFQKNIKKLFFSESMIF